MSGEYTNPATRRGWEPKASKLGLLTKRVFDLAYDDVNSASKAGEQQFLCLRVLWKKNYQVQFEAATWLSEDSITAAQDFMDHTDFKPIWKSYLAAIPAKQEVFPLKVFEKLGPFSLVLKHQLAVKRLEASDQDEDAGFDEERASEKVSPISKRTRSSKAKQVNPEETPPNQRRDISASLADLGPVSGSTPDFALSIASSTPAFTPPSNDEQTVNTALILFLDAVTFSCPAVGLRWVLDRKSFNFGGLFNARTDGMLEGRKSRKVKAILEVKAYVRKAIKQQASILYIKIFINKRKENF